MKTTKRYLAFLLCLVLAICAVTGCGQNNSGKTNGNNTSNSSNSGDAQTTDEEPITIKFWWAPTFADEEVNRKWMDDTLADFYKEHPNVTIDFLMVPWAEYASKLALSLSEGTDCPDIFYTFPEQVWEFAEAGWLHPVDDYFTEEDKADFLGVEDGSYEGKFYMPPILYSEYCYLYNGDILDEIGWDRNNLPTTLEELDQLFAAAHEKGYYGGGLHINEYDHLSAILHYSWGIGKDYVDREGNVTTVDNEALKKVFEYQVEWMEKGYLPEDCYVMSADLSQADNTRFLNGESVMNFTPGMTLKTEEFQNSEIDYIVGPYPKVDESAKNVGVGIACGFAMSEACENKDIAGEIMNILTQAQAQVSFNEQVGYMCARKSCGNIFEDLRGFNELADVFANLDESYGATWHFITSSLANSILAERQAMYMGEQTVDETLQKIADLLQEGLDNR